MKKILILKPNLIKTWKKYFIIDCPRKKLDLTNQSAVKKWFKYNKPNYVINAAGKVGGVLDNSLYKTEYLYNNILIGFNLLKSIF